jgi:hypothetical protein
MPTTKQIPRDEWQSYFERFTKQHLVGGPPEAGTIEVVSPVIGDQLEARATHLEGLSYDPKSNAFEVWLEDIDHLVFDPAEIWVIEEDDGLVSTIELVAADGAKQIVYLQRSGPPAPLHEAGPPPQS